MLQSKLFTKVATTFPKDEEAINAKYLIRAGFIHKEMAGVYSYLPLGIRVFKKIEQVIREEMDAIGGQELVMSALQSPKVWQASDRWSDEAIDVWFKTTLKDGGELGLATTHEEPITALMQEYIQSYKDLPRYPYQFQTKFRNELRARSGIVRTREFVMKDLYSFSRSEEEFRKFYEECAEAYMRIFARVGLGEHTVRTFASGGSFSKYSDEFQTICDAGEDTIYVDRKKKIAVNKEVHTDEVLADLGLNKNELEEVRAIEVGNIFPLGTRFSDALGLRYKDEEGKEIPVIMGSYGIGPGRLMGTIVEVLADEKGIVWPESVAPYRVHLLAFAGGDKNEVAKQGDKLYAQLSKQGIEVLYDDRDISPGKKLADADFIGIPYRVIVSEKTGDKVEVKKRNEKEATLMEVSAFLKVLSPKS